jgi:hypothetical protein
MSASNEWVERHLTPSGWTKGSCHLDFGKAVIVEPPKDRVLTCEYKEYMSSVYSKLETSITEEWRSKDEKIIQELLKKFGECPTGFY